MKSLLLILTILISSVGYSKNSCSEALVDPELAYSANPIQQLMVWEQSSNQTRWRKPNEAQSIRTVKVQPEEVIVRKVGVPAELNEYLALDQPEINYPLHPLNKAPVPFQDRETKGAMDVYYSASRSMFFMVAGQFFSIKMPTDRPHPEAAAQVGKANLVNDVIISMRRSQHIQDVESLAGEAQGLKILTEVVSVADKHSNNGFLVRDLRPLQDGHLYLPAFSIPYAGRSIARRLKVDFDTLWGESYATTLGRAKAEYLLRYGLEMKTPNAQNWLIQLDKSLKPTGKIYLRDVPDSNYVDFVAAKVGAAKPMQDDVDSGYSIIRELNPNWSNSAWQMDEGDVSPATLQAWGVLHDRAYIETIRTELNIEQHFATILELENFLKSEAGQALLHAYAHRMKLVFYFKVYRGDFSLLMAAS